MKDRETLHYFRNFFKLNIVTVAQLVESCATVFLCIAVHSAEEIVDAEIGHYEREESQRHEEMERCRAAQLSHRTRMQRYGVYHERDECPHLLRVPSPILAPRDISPDGSDEDADAERGKCRIEKHERELLQLHHLRLRRATDEAQQKGGEPTDEREREHGKTHHYYRHVHAEQRRVEHGHRVLYLRIHLSDVTHEQEEARHKETQRHEQAEAHATDEREQLYEPRHEEHRLVAVGHRERAADCPAQILAIGERTERQKHHYIVDNEKRYVQSLAAHAQSVIAVCTFSVRAVVLTAHSYYSVKKRDYAHRQTHHEEYCGEGDAVVYTLGCDTSVGRQRCSPILLLILQHLTHHGIHLRIVGG